MRDTKLSKQLVVIIQFFTQAKHEGHYWDSLVVLKNAWHKTL